MTQCVKQKRKQEPVTKLQPLLSHLPQPQSFWKAVEEKISGLFEASIEDTLLAIDVNYAALM